MNFKVGSKIVNKFTKEVFEVIAIEIIEEHAVYVVTDIKSGMKNRFNSSFLYCYNLFDESKKQ